MPGIQKLGGGSASGVTAASIDVFELSDAARTLNGTLPTGAIAQNFPRWDTGNSGAMLAQGGLHLVAGIVLPQGRAITSVTFFSGTQAGVTLTNQWFCLVQLSDLTVLRKTVDDTTAAWAADAPKTLALSSTYTPSVDLPVYVGITVAAATRPSLRGKAASNTVGALAPILSGASTTGLTDPASLGAAAAALVANANVPYCYVS